MSRPCYCESQIRYKSYKSHSTSDYQWLLQNVLPQSSHPVGDKCAIVNHGRAAQMPHCACLPIRALLCKCCERCCRKNGCCCESAVVNSDAMRRVMRPRQAQQCIIVLCNIVYIDWSLLVLISLWLSTCDSTAAVSADLNILSSLAKSTMTD